jgi:hypothetical protein
MGGSVLLTPALASDPKKEPPKPVEKEIKYVDEAGAEGRGGNVYKRVEHEKYDEPQLKAKEPPAPPPKPAKDDGHGKKDDGHGAPPKKEEKKDDHGKKDEKKDDHGKKDDKKKDDGHGAPKKDEKKKDAHGKDAHGKKPEPPAYSALYDPKLIKLNSANRPFTEPKRSTKHADYFLCRGVLRDRFRETILAEMNTFADRMDLPRAMDVPCMVKVAKPNAKFPGAIYVEFYTDDKAALACMRGGDCGATRLMMLFPKDKTGKKSKEIYRSYVLTDEKQYTRGAFCVSPDGQFLGEKNCYVTLNPDWLFN